MTRLFHRPLLAPLNNHVVDYPTPVNLSYLWSFGALAGVCLVVQIATGVFLTMQYCPHVDLAFDSVERIMRDVQAGWLLRYLHANGASFFFIVVYLHIAKGLYYGSYLRPKGPLWISGCAIFVLLMAVAFIGYVLPWGQMSLWGATVITSLFGALPVVGESIVLWLWGGFSVDNATLNRFLSLHYLLPFVVAALSLVHLYLLHTYGSSNPLGTEAKGYAIPFYPYLYVKDVFSVVVFFLVFGAFVFYAPNVLGHSDNYIPANPMVTPASIVPEFYFLPFYAILRAVPDKLLGVLAMGGAIASLFALPFYTRSLIRSTVFRPVYRAVFWAFVVTVLLLGYLGSQHVEEPFVTLGQVFTLAYFGLLWVGIPLAEYLETTLVVEGGAARA